MSSQNTHLMKAIGIFEAKSTLSQLVNQVESGEQIVLTRHGKPVARLAPLAESAAPRSAKEWAGDLRRFRRGRDRGAKRGATLSELIREGRR